VQHQSSPLPNDLRARGLAVEQDLLALVAHELRGPLEAIGMAAGVAARSPQPEVQQRAIRRIERQADQMLWLVKDLLDIGHANSGRLGIRVEPLELGEVLDSGIEIARPVIDAQQQHLAVPAAARSLAVRGDRARLTQIIANLVINVSYSTEPRGEVTITAERLESSLAIEVAASGSRSSTEALRPSPLAGRAARGAASPQALEGRLGIGFALTRKLIALHGGRLEIADPAPSRGGRFRVILPQ